MAQVTVTVNQRAYTIVCDDGEEDHLHDLARYVDAQVMNLVKNVGQIGEARLLLMGALLIADQLAEADEKLETLEAGVAKVEGRMVNVPDAEPTMVASRMLESAAKRIEALAAKLERP
jgi:cell division protein ZapA